MWVLVAYDVTTDTAAGRTRLRRVAQVCKNYGQRVQKSVFECTVTRAQYEQMRRDLLREIDAKADSLKLYRLLTPREKSVEEFGVTSVIDFSEPLVI